MITYHILFSFFTLFALLSFVKFVRDGIGNLHAILMFISVVISAFTANKIF